jgi:phage-related minor tail protein
MMPLLRGIDNLFSLGLDLNATGGVFGKDGKIQAYAKGGVVTQPTFFRYGASGNLGLMGEAGMPEAILPLKRGRSGNLGVEASGGGSTNKVVNVDASGSSVEGDSGQANEFGNVLAQAIQAELIAQKRAGGLLSNA